MKFLSVFRWGCWTLIRLRSSSTEIFPRKFLLSLAEIQTYAVSVSCLDSPHSFCPSWSLICLQDKSSPCSTKRTVTRVHRYCHNILCTSEPSHKEKQGKAMLSSGARWATLPRHPSCGSLALESLPSTHDSVPTDRSWARRAHSLPPHLTSCECQLCWPSWVRGNLLFGDIAGFTFGHQRELWNAHSYLFFLILAWKIITINTCRNSKVMVQTSFFQKQGTTRGNVSHTEMSFLSFLFT